MPSYKIIVGVSDRETEELFSEEQLEQGITQHEQKRRATFYFLAKPRISYNRRTDLPIIYEKWTSNLVNTINRLLRTLVRNTYMHHLNEIFYTVENEYSPVGAAATPQAVRDKVFSVLSKFFIPVKVSEALGDKLYMSPALETASWCNESGYVVHLYLHPTLVSWLFWLSGHRKIYNNRWIYVLHKPF